MIIVVIGISFLLGAFIIMIDGECDETLTIPVIGLLIKLGVVLWLFSKIIQGRTIDEKIEMYQDQNNEIEQKIEIVVKEYMKFENELYPELKSESYISLVSLYPDIKSDTLVAHQIELYESNNRKITKLKEQKIKIKEYKWWLYFGGNK